MNDSETVLLIDKWADQSALDAQHQTPMMEKIATLRDKYHLRMHAEKFTKL